MTREYIEDAVSRVVERSKSEGFKSVGLIGDPLSSSDIRRLRDVSNFRIPSDYADFLMSANGIKIEFYLRRTPTDVYPAFTFWIVGIPEAFERTKEWRTKSFNYIREAEEPPATILRKPYRDLVESVVLIDPVSHVFIHPDTSRVYIEELSDLFGRGMLLEVADSFDQYFERSFEEMMREGYRPHL